MSHVGKYQLVSKLATGGMAEVFLAKAAGPMGFEKTLVLKQILPHLAEDPQFVEMFLGEAKLAAQLNHPNIVQIFDFGESEGAYYLAMEYIDGPNLRILSKRARAAGVPLPPAYCAKIIASACEGLAFAHDFVDPDTGESLGLIHRDISPDNILLSRQGAVKVVDFGIAKAANQSHKTQTGLIKGKIAYMPPEQLQARHLDQRVDVYALGVVLYELLTGQKPFDATTDVSMMQAILFEPLVPAVSRRADLPRAMVQILDRALAKVREHRYPDCRAFQADLEHFILSTGEPVGAYQLSQLVARLSGDNAGPGSTSSAGSGPKSRPGSGTRLPASESVAQASSSRSSGGTRAASANPSSVDSATRVAQNEDEPDTIRSEPVPPATLISSSRPAATAVGPEAEDVALALPKRRTGLVLGLGGIVLLAAGGAIVFLRGGSEPQPSPSPIEIRSNSPSTKGTSQGTGSASTGTPPVDVPPAGTESQPKVAAVDPATNPLPPQPPEGDKPAPKPSDEKTAPVAGLSTPPDKDKEPSGKKPKNGGGVRPPPPSTLRRATVEKASLEFRIRPYAIVVLDGRQLGQTPLAAAEVEVGSHTVKLINKDLGKEITRTFEVKAGQPNIFKHNLLED
ncbi:protein kinase [Archangium violaceum]|nr:serine/threonine-protein kinase [Archangium violaceum]QRO00547.1 protein kinase [Archangium violaceum]